MMARVLASVIAIGASAGVALGITAMVTSYYDDTTEVCTVSGKDRVWKQTDNKGSGHSEMRVYTEECGTLVVGDSLVKGQFRSADLFGKLKEGDRYEFTHHGWRNGFLSMFPTITEAKPA